MFLPLIPLRAIMVLGLNESDLGPSLRTLQSDSALPVKPDPEPQRSRFTRSDQYSFIRNGVPSLAFKFHAEPNTPEGEVLADWTKERYHAPSDDLKQPVNLEGAAHFNEVMTAFLMDVADRQSRPQWNPRQLLPALRCRRQNDSAGARFSQRWPQRCRAWQQQPEIPFVCPMDPEVRSADQASVLAAG